MTVVAETLSTGPDRAAQTSTGEWYAGQPSHKEAEVERTNRQFISSGNLLVSASETFVIQLRKIDNLYFSLMADARQGHLFAYDKRQAP